MEGVGAMTYPESAVSDSAASRWAGVGCSAGVDEWVRYVDDIAGRPGGAAPRKDPSFARGVRGGLGRLRICHFPRGTEKVELRIHVM